MLQRCSSGRDSLVAIAAVKKWHAGEVAGLLQPRHATCVLRDTTPALRWSSPGFGDLLAIAAVENLLAHAQGGGRDLAHFVRMHVRDHLL